MNDAHELGFISLPRMHPAAFHLDLRWVWRKKENLVVRDKKKEGREVSQAI